MASALSEISGTTLSQSPASAEPPAFTESELGTLEDLEGSRLAAVQEASLNVAVQEWLDERRANGRIPLASSYTPLSISFLKDKLADIFEILPQDLRESDKDLRIRVGYIIRHSVSLHSDDPSIDESLPLHRQIWDSLAQKLDVWQGIKKDSAPRFKELFEQYGSSALFELLKECADSVLWEECVVGGRSVDPRFLHSLPEDYKHEQPGWYLIFMWDPARDVQTWYRVYVGQAGGGERSERTIVKRCDQHRSSSTKPKAGQVVYKTWRAFLDDIDPDKMRHVKFLKLGFAPDRSFFEQDLDFDLFLSTGEMYFSLIFRSLQVHDLCIWLPRMAEARSRSPVGLNVSLPLSQGYQLESRMQFGKLAHSPDPDLRAYARAVLRKNIEKVYADNRNQTQAIRKKSEWHKIGLIRSAPKGETIRVRCRCGWEKDDISPVYVVRTGQYLGRFTACHNCPPTESGKTKKKELHGVKMFMPVDSTMTAVTIRVLRHRVLKHKLHDLWQSYLLGTRASPPEIVTEHWTW